ALQARQSVVHDGDGVLAARIVTRQDYEIAATSGGFAHQRTLGAVAIATATEYGDDASRPAPLVEEVVGHGRQVADGIIRVGIVHDHRERLPKVEPLEASGDVRNL